MCNSDLLCMSNQSTSADVLGRPIMLPRQVLQLTSRGSVSPSSTDTMTGAFILQGKNNRQQRVSQVLLPLH
jgi:hypothetical protein